MSDTIASKITQAFILGAGLGTRLKPLTDILPKPLIPFFNRPLIFHLLQWCYNAGIRDFIVNTHHLAHCWQQVFSVTHQPDYSVQFCYEPELLDSGGGLKNIEPLLTKDSHVLIVNGDTAATFNLSKLIHHHLANHNSITLALRRSGYNRNVGFDVSTGLITDIRNQLGITQGTHQFTGAYCLHTSVLRYLPADTPCSIIPLFIQYARQHQLHGIEVNDGLWLDLGTPQAYLQAHKDFPYTEQRIHPSAKIADDVEISSDCVIGPRARIGKGCRLQNCIVWQDVEIPAGTCAVNKVFYQSIHNL